MEVVFTAAFFTVFGHYVTVNHNILSALSVLYDKKEIDIHVAIDNKHYKKDNYKIFLLQSNVKRSTIYIKESGNKHSLYSITFPNSSNLMMDCDTIYYYH